MASVKKNFSYQMIYEILIIILPFITSPYIARVIGAEGLGIYSFSYSVAYYFVLFSMLGLKNYGNRTIAQNRDNQTSLNEAFSSLFTLHAVISIICLLVYIGYIFTLKKDRLYAVIQIMYVLSGLLDISWFYFGIEKFKLTVTRNVIIRLATVASVFLFVKDSHDLWKYCVILSVGHFISQATLWLPLHKYVKFSKTDFSMIKPHIKPMLILFIPAIAVSLYKYMDKIMIGAMASKTQLGFYENAEKVSNIPSTIINSFGIVMLPKMSNLAAKADNRKSLHYIKISMKYVMCLSFALAFGMAAIGGVFAPVFWGEEFITSGTLIMGLAVTLPFIAFANVIRTQYLIPQKKDKAYLSSVVCGAVVNLIINTILIKPMGAMGAMFGTIAAEIIVCLIQSFVVRKELPIGSFLRSIWIFPIFGMAMFSIVYLIGHIMGNSVLTLCVQVLCGGIIYVGAVIIYFFITKEEIFLKMYRTACEKFKKKI